MGVSLAPGRQSPGSRRFPKRIGVAILMATAVVSLAMGTADLRNSQRLHTDGVLTRARLSGAASNEAEVGDITT